MWQSFLLWLETNRIGDISGVLGIVISVGGFGLTLWNVLRSKKAAESAEKAAQSTRDALAAFDTTVDFTSAIAILEEIKRAHREKNWIVLPDRYAAIRKLLITLRSSGAPLSEPSLLAIQGSLVNLKAIEDAVEKYLQNGATDKTKLNGAKYNSVLSDDIDRLVEMLASLKASQGARQ